MQDWSPLHFEHHLLDYKGRGNDVSLKFSAMLPKMAGALMFNFSWCSVSVNSERWLECCHHLPSSPFAKTSASMYIRQLLVQCQHPQINFACRRGRTRHRSITRQIPATAERAPNYCDGRQRSASSGAGLPLIIKPRYVLKATIIYRTGTCQLLGIAGLPARCRQRTSKWIEFVVVLARERILPIPECSVCYLKINVSRAAAMPVCLPEAIGYEII